MSKINWNSKDAKHFRNIMSDYYNAIHGINDTILQFSSQKKACNTIISSDYETLVSMLGGNYSGLRTLKEVYNDIDFIKARLESINKEIEELTTEQSVIIEKTLALYTDEMYNAACGVIENFGNIASRNDWRQSVLNMFRSCGMACDGIVSADLAEYDSLILIKENNGKKLMLSEVSAAGKKKQASLFFKGLVKFMVAKNYLHPYTYKFTAKKEKPATAKKEETATAKKEKPATAKK